MLASPRAIPRLLAALVLPLLAGCGLFYENSYQGKSFTLYSDRKPEFLAKVGPKVTRIYQGYQQLFGLSENRLGTTTIVLHGDDTGVIDYGYSPSLLGYYIPLFNYISVDTACAWAQGDEMLEQILLHEVSHHFIVTEFPGASQECWLNEGLAGALEVTVFDDQSFEHPLLNPILFQVAQKAACEQSDLKLQDFLALSWGQFHDHEDKEAHYALAWSLVYFLIERQMPQDLPLGERIEKLYTWDREAIAKLESRWFAFLRGFDLTGALLDLATGRRGAGALTSRWAIGQLGDLRTLDELRALVGLTSFFDDADQAKRALAFFAFLRVLERTEHSYVLGDQRVVHALHRLQAILLDPEEPAALREALAVAVGESLRTSDRWVSGLVHVLDDGDGRLRAAAARTLSRIASKPTIVNPAFWLNASGKLRAQEVGEWRRWLDDQGPDNP